MLLSVPPFTIRKFVLNYKGKNSDHTYNHIHNHDIIDKLKSASPPVSNYQVSLACMRNRYLIYCGHNNKVVMSQQIVR